MPRPFTGEQVTNRRSRASILILPMQLTFYCRAIATFSRSSGLIK